MFKSRSIRYKMGAYRNSFFVFVSNPGIIRSENLERFSQ